MTLACEDSNSIFFDVVTVVYVDDDDELMIVVATVCCRFGSSGLVKKLNFCSDFEHKVWSKF